MWFRKFNSLLSRYSSLSVVSTEVLCSLNPKRSNVSAPLDYDINLFAVEGAVSCVLPMVG